MFGNLWQVNLKPERYVKYQNFSQSNIFAAIAIHKVVIMFCVCLKLHQTGTKKLPFFSYLTVFSFIGPLGIGINFEQIKVLSSSWPRLALFAMCFVQN